MPLSKVKVKKEKGQTAVEYILLLAVIVVLVQSIYNNQLFKKVFSAESPFFQVFKNQSKINYTHALMPSSSSQGQPHPSYVNEKGQSRFFLPLTPYPGN